MNTDKCPSSSPMSHTSTLDERKVSHQLGGHPAERDSSALRGEKKYEVQLERDDDPQELPLFRRWLAVATISGAALCVAGASSIASVSNTKRTYHSLELLYLCTITGCFHGRCRVSTIPCGKRSSNLGDQPLCHWSRHRSPLFRAIVRSLRTEHCLSGVIHSFLRLYVSCRLCTRHW
jgi:hypothetical protein